MITLLRYELEKIIKSKFFVGLIITTIIVLGGVYVVGFTFTQYSNVKADTTEKGHSELYHEIAAKHEGELTDQKVKEIVSDYLDRFQSESPENRYFNLFAYYFVELFVTGEEDLTMRMIESVENQTKLTIDDIELLSVEDVGFAKLDQPLIVGAYTPWHDLFNLGEPLFFIVSLFAILICSSVFSNEVASNISQLLLSTKYGRSKLILSKIIAATVISLLAFVIIHGITFILFNIYNSGMGGWNASIQTNLELELFDFPVGLNNLQIYFHIIAFQLFAVLSIAGVTLFVSSITKSSFTSLFVGVGIFALPIGLIQIFKSGIINTLLYLFPINLFKLKTMLKLYSDHYTDFEFVFNGSFATNFAIALCILLVIKIVADVLTYVRVKTLYD